MSYENKYLIQNNLGYVCKKTEQEAERWND